MNCACLLLHVYWSVFDLLNRICRLKKSEETFCVRDRYTNSPTATSFIQCKTIIKTVGLSEKLTNIECLNHVARVAKPSGILPIFMASRTDNLFHFTTLFQLFQLFITTRLDIALYKTHTHILVLNI